MRCSYLSVHISKYKNCSPRQRLIESWCFYLEIIEILWKHKFVWTDHIFKAFSPFSSRNVLFFPHWFIWLTQSNWACCCGMSLTAVCAGVCLFAADDLTELWCAVTLPFVYFSSEQCKLIFWTLWLLEHPSARGMWQRRALSTNQIDMLQAYLHKIMKTAVRYL